MRNSKFEIPESLRTFAMATVGSYPARYDQIMDIAFSKYQIIPGALTLRQLAGGGSNSTAQSAVDRFKVKLHTSVSSRIEFNVEIPDEISSKFSSGIADLWSFCMKRASDEFTRDRENFEIEINKSKSREEILDKTCTEHVDRIENLESNQKKLLDTIDALTHQINVIKIENSALVDENARTCQFKDSEIQQLANKIKILENSIQNQQLHLKSIVEAHVSEKESLRQESNRFIRIAQEEHKIEVNRLLKEKQDALSQMSILNKENVEYTLKLAHAQLALHQSAEALKIAHENSMKENDAHQISITEMQNKIDFLNHSIIELTNKLNVKNDLETSLQAKINIMNQLLSTGFNNKE